MRLHLKLIVFITFFSSALCFGQKDDDTTVFITSTEELKSKKDKYNEGHFFTQYALSMAFVGNPNSGEYNEVTQDNEPIIMMGGLGGYASIGAHYHKWIGVAVNTGLEWRESHDLTSAPVYGTVISYLHFNEDSGIYLEGGYGAVFGINKSKVWGDYQKYKLGVIIQDHVSIFLDYSIQDYPSQEFNNIQSISLGVSLINFW